MDENNNIKEKYNNAWTALTLLMVLVFLAFVGPEKSNVDSPAENSNILYDDEELQLPTESFDTQYDDEESVEKLLETNYDVTEEIINNNEEQQPLLINLPFDENQTKMFDGTLDIDKIYVFETNKGEVISITEGDDKVKDRVTYDIDCQSGDEIMPFNIFVDFLDTGYYEDIMHDAYALPLINGEGIAYQTNDFKNAFMLRGLKMVSLREFLEYNGFESEIKDTCTYDEVVDLYYKFNRTVEPKKRTLKQ